MKLRFTAWAFAAAATFTVSAWAKLPPSSDEAKAKAAEAAQKAAATAKVEAYKLCQSMDRVAARYIAEAKSAGKVITPTPTPACVDPASTPAAPVAAAATPAPAPKK